MSIHRVVSPDVPEPPPERWSNCLVSDGIAYVSGMTARGLDAKLEVERLAVEWFALGRGFEQRELLGVEYSVVGLAGLLARPDELHRITE